MTRDKKEDLLALVILAVGIGFRFMDLGLRPFHHDEGVNGFFLGRLLNEGVYRYDPSNYHGPTLFYFTAPIALLFGVSDVTVRGTTALFGVLTLIALWRLLRRESVAFGLSAMAFLAVSPGAVFFSRYYIHETLFIAFTLFAVVASPWAGSVARWRFAACGAMLGFLFATKETAFVSVLAVSGGLVMAAWLVERRSPIRVAREARAFLLRHPEDLMQTFSAFVISAGVLYSGFFLNPRGVLDAFRTFAFWTKTATRDHANAWNQHFLWIAEADPVLLWMGLAGAALALVLRRSFLGVLSAVWTALIFIAYMIPSYKTPWLGLNMLLPLAISAGYLVFEISRVSFLEGALSLRTLALLVALGGCGRSAAMSYELETKRYDDENHPYLYAHTQRSFLDFVKLVEERALATGKGKEATIAVFAPENWPLPWYLRDYKNAGYWGEYKSEIDADLFVGSVEQDALLQMKLQGRYERFGPYHLRGVVNLYLYSRATP